MAGSETDGRKPFTIELWIRPRAFSEEQGITDAKLVFGRPNQCRATTVVLKDAFSYVVATYDGMKSRVYQDAVLVAECETIASLSTIENLSVGARLDADLDEVALYARALTEDRIKEKFRLGGR